MQEQIIFTSGVLASWASASGESGCHIEFDRDHWRGDIDGAASGHANPHAILDAALAACTALTLELYVKHKGWFVSRIDVTVAHRQVDGVYRMARQIVVEGDLTAEQRAALVRIAGVCPVHKTLTGEIAIDTSLA
jgi:putative redox protein